MDEKINIEFSFCELWTVIDMVREKLYKQNSFVREEHEVLLKLENHLEEYKKKHNIKYG